MEGRKVQRKCKVQALENILESMKNKNRRILRTVIDDNTRDANPILISCIVKSPREGEPDIFVSESEDECIDPVPLLPPEEESIVVESDTELSAPQSSRIDRSAELLPEGDSESENASIDPLSLLLPEEDSVVVESDTELSAPQSSRIDRSAQLLPEGDSESENASIDPLSLLLPEEDSVVVESDTELSAPQSLNECPPTKRRRTSTSVSVSRTTVPCHSIEHALPKLSSVPTAVISHIRKPCLIRKNAIKSMNDWPSRKELTTGGGPNRCRTNEKENMVSRTNDEVFNTIPVSFYHSEDEDDHPQNRSLSDENEQSHATNQVDNVSNDCPYLRKKNVFVFGCNNTERQVFDKKDVCLYCHRELLSICLARHLYSLHSNEEAVAAIMRLEKNSLEKKRALQLLRNKGNYRYNLESLQKGGNIIVVQRPPKTTDISSCLDSYVCCGRCSGFYSSTDIWRHTCPAGPKYPREGNRTSSNSDLRTLSSNVQVQSFFKKQKKDDIADIAFNDRSITRFITDEMITRGMEKYSSISAKVRSLCHFLKICRLNMKNMKLSFEDLLRPSNFDTLRHVILMEFQYNCETENSITMDRPASLKKLCQSLVQLTKNINKEHLKHNNEQLAKETKILLTLMDSELRPVMTNATCVMRKPASGNPKSLPLQTDIDKLKLHINHKLSTLKMNHENLRLIRMYTLAYLIMFNKRRSMEVAKLTTDIWQGRGDWKEIATSDKSKMTDEERRILQKTELVYIKGKCRRLVPIIFPENSVPIVNWLSKNCHKFIFENNAKNCIRGNDAVRNVAENAGIASNMVNSVAFRKLMATNLQSSDLNESQYRYICEHLGHTQDVHQRYYKMHDTAIELVKVGQILQENYTTQIPPRKLQASPKGGRKGRKKK